MNLLATFRIALHALRVNKLRSILTMLGIIIGVGAVITMIAVGAGAQARVEEQIKSLGSNLMIIIPGSTMASGVRLGAGANQNLTEDDALAIAKEVPEVQVAAPTNRGSGQVVSGNNNWSTQIYGVTPDYFEAREWPLAQGRMFEPAELSGSAKVALIGQTVARQLFGDMDPVDQSIRIRNVPFVVIGLLERKGQSMLGQDQDDVIMVPLSTARNRLFGNTQGKLRRVGTIQVKVREGANMKDAEDHIRELLRQRQRTQPGQEDAFTIRNLTEILQAQEASSRVMTLLLAAVASVSLLVGGIGIMNIMLVSVTERTREIGLRMAVGAKGRDILTQFLVEAVTLSLIGGFFGIVLGVGGSWLVGAFAGWSTRLSPESVVLAVGFSAAIGIFFGYFPAHKAASMLPIQALRYE
ncbi:ABC transporter permease [Noviherbaspirillum autotrophicum]|uniref:Multidrug ABC transporter substrate-binding protein n=1 Tax=Noviherbaspirillum autotrophicum TaxID=709839 RepID=A0A0C1YML3_9BURK|nr:ABC transporter permease [Noviherbaspirillum autotrophicum]KIF81777.1 multidrug ABC transporter substrate-binding protein [Noviherbaspirillum autotrophicum]